MNSGEDATGKTAKIEITKVNSGFLNLYYNGWAGEHLNFVSETKPEFEAGDSVTVRITEVSDFLGSWIIAYELIK